ncbi:PhzF family phenazine biosynthesis protein [Desulfocurvus sp.]|uniref:PhzF family phenazine biosynthesis protein n=1 Tax=Desulfocurvus sp. TaxID=2871698 RepID=UPI0025B7F372|nr:PhzF family phenazine biosynthesis protein [Desulfocurvus sp.]MCK9240238.1 PhzF family phenazine biosynthesis protein [Desulfocurvus sp.]
MTPGTPPRARHLPPGLAWRQADVFSRLPLGGNGLAVFADARGLDAALMQALTRELRQFESIFLTPGERPGAWRARMFTVDEELDFAGHPVLGAACVLHEARDMARGAAPAEAATWTLALNAREVTVATRRAGSWYEAEMDQGAPLFGPPLDGDTARALLRAQGLDESDLAPGLPARMVSTGLPYLLVPLRRGLERARPASADFAALLAAVGAHFCYPLDIAAREGRSFDNHGLLEDPATGSAAGPAGAYLVRHGLARPGQELTIRQGRFVHRPSEIRVCVQGPARAPERVLVAGDVVMAARGAFD